MKKTFYIGLLSICLFAQNVSANTSPVDIKIKIIDSNTADITLTYATPFQESTFSVLPSLKQDLSGIYSTYELISAKTIKGEVREFNDYQDGQSDAIVYTKPTDQFIKVTYRLDNGLQNNNVSLFRFPLFLGANYSKQANISIEYPTNFLLLAYPNSQHITATPGKIVTTKVSAPERISDYYEYDIFVLAQKKTGTYTTKKIGNNFTLTSSPKVSATATKLVKDIQVYAPKYKEILGASLPNRVVIVVTPIRYKLRQYEVEAVQISNNIVLMDQESFNSKTPDLFRKKVLIHELAHVAVGNAGLFRKEPYYARWFDEGLAVFFEQYISDTYLHKGMSAEKIRKSSLGYQKLTPIEANEEYKNYFDYSVSINNDKQNISNTYNHAGLIFYNLHLKNKNHIPNLLSNLRGTPTAGACSTCDSDNIVQILTTMTGLSKDDILYPYDKTLKDNMYGLYNDTTASKLFLID